MSESSSAQSSSSTADEESTANNPSELQVMVHECSSSNSEKDPSPSPHSNARRLSNLLSTLTIEEAIEKEKRDRTIVIHGVPESTALKASQRVADDLVKVSALLDLAELEHSPASIFRVGHLWHGRPRLLKVTFHTRAAQRALLANARRISSRWPYVFIHPSLTRAERDEAFQLRNKRRRLQAEGKDVIVYAGLIIERSQLESVKKEVNSCTYSNRSHPNCHIPS